MIENLKMKFEWRFTHIFAHDIRTTTISSPDWPTWVMIMNELVWFLGRFDFFSWMKFYPHHSFHPRHHTLSPRWPSWIMTMNEFRIILIFETLLCFACFFIMNDVFNNFAMIFQTHFSRYTHLKMFRNDQDP